MMRQPLVIYGLLFIVAIATPQGVVAEKCGPGSSCGGDSGSEKTSTSPAEPAALAEGDKQEEQLKQQAAQRLAAQQSEAQDQQPAQQREAQEQQPAQQGRAQGQQAGEDAREDPKENVQYGNKLMAEKWKKLWKEQDYLKNVLGGPMLLHQPHEDTCDLQFTQILEGSHPVAAELGTVVAQLLPSGLEVKGDLPVYHGGKSIKTETPLPEPAVLLDPQHCATYLGASYPQEFRGVIIQRGATAEHVQVHTSVYDRLKMDPQREGRRLRLNAIVVQGLGGSTTNALQQQAVDQRRTHEGDKEEFRVMTWGTFLKEVPVDHAGSGDGETSTAAALAREQRAKIEKAKKQPDDSPEQAQPGYTFLPGENSSEDLAITHEELNEIAKRGHRLAAFYSKQRKGKRNQASMIEECPMSNEFLTECKWSAIVGILAAEGDDLAWLQKWVKENEDGADPFRIPIWWYRYGDPEKKDVLKMLAENPKFEDMKILTSKGVQEKAAVEAEDRAGAPSEGPSSFAQNKTISSWNNFSDAGSRPGQEVKQHFGKPGNRNDVAATPSSLPPSTTPSSVVYSTSNRGGATAFTTPEDSANIINLLGDDKKSYHQEQLHSEEDIYDQGDKKSVQVPNTNQAGVTHVASTSASTTSTGPSLSLGEAFRFWARSVDDYLRTIPPYLALPSACTFFAALVWWLFLFDTHKPRQTPFGVEDKRGRELLSSSSDLLDQSLELQQLQQERMKKYGDESNTTEEEESTTRGADESGILGFLNKRSKTTTQEGGLSSQPGEDGGIVDALSINDAEYVDGEDEHTAFLQYDGAQQHGT
ncbi:unnamed protein product [Amoebophrya sp. A25]|nr:unnamed protein product [Amoebophrya sp. A25]|eukprot:GSA25T00011053001.1